MAGRVITTRIFHVSLICYTHGLVESRSVKRLHVKRVTFIRRNHYYRSTRSSRFYKKSKIKSRKETKNNLNATSKYKFDGIYLTKKHFLQGMGIWI